MMIERIEKKLNQAFMAGHIQVINESHGHHVPAGSQTHFNVVVVDAAFAGLSRVRRHQHVYGLLEEEMTSGVHALALHLYTPEEWQSDQRVPGSPVCQGRR
ncbi:MAG: BolA/IbaG family iron-sulfur metabolism protein [Pseudomonadales bacterium]|nr:BolA/IbaG family iron-sulfur metabolism protein [Pseudomonadales bacterium]